MSANMDMHDASMGPYRVNPSAHDASAGIETRAAKPAMHGASVMAAMSGGVDSSVVAYLLQQQGYEVAGCTMELLGRADGEEVRSARDVCGKLRLPHLTVDFSSRFAADVIDSFCNAYLGGKTPNPCVTCNRCIKFGALHDYRKEQGFDFLATGHYVRCEFDEDLGKFVLKKGLDAGKDQSYVLYSLTQDQLAHSLFPLGGLSKDQVRGIARDLKLSNADAGESQDICFVPDGDYMTFIERYTGCSLQCGDIVDEAGVKLGEHLGLAHFTIGQRKGLGIACGHPMFVLEKDVERNRLVVGPAESQGIGRLWADKVNLVHLDGLPEPTHVQVKVNYRARPVGALVYIDNAGLLQVRFDDPVRSCAAGQACVLYQGDIVLGGGIIAGFAR